MVEKLQELKQKVGEMEGRDKSTGKQLNTVTNCWDNVFFLLQFLKHSLLQHLFLATDFEQVAGEVYLVQVVVDPAESLTDQQLHWRTHWKKKKKNKGTKMIVETNDEGKYKVIMEGWW